MDRTRLTGTLLMAATALQLLLFVVGALRRSYTALALPVAGLVAMLSLLGFWVGWTLATMEDDLTGLEFDAEPILKDALKGGDFHLTADSADLTGMGAVVITVGTPVDEYLNPVHKAIRECVDGL